MGGLADPECQGGTINIDALTRIDLALAIQWQVISILRDDHAGDGCFGWHTAFDQARLCGCLGNPGLTRPASILGTAGYKDTELGRYDVQPFTDIFADDVAFVSTATGDVRCNDLFDARQVLWQDTTPFD